MDALLLTVAAVGVVILVAWVLSYRATRIDRLHARVEGCWHALDAVLVRRSEALLELANAGVLDPASALLLSDAASDTLEYTGEREGRVRRENDLAALASLLLAEAEPRALAGFDTAMRTTVEQAVRQVDVAAAFYNEAVANVVAIRDQVITKIACLAGKAPRLQPIDVRSVDLPLQLATIAPVRGEVEPRARS